MPATSLISRTEADWRYLLESVQEENCVLVVGPDVVRTAEGTLFEALSALLRERFSERDLYIYPSEELFHYSKPYLKNSVGRIIREFYANHSHLQDFYAQLADLPLPLIVSLLPDKGLHARLVSHVVDAQFGYQPRTAAPQPVGDPSIQAPLVYNLLGIADDSEQLILTFNDLFEYLSGIMGSRELPTNLKNALARARTFVFLGVQFDKWYMQLLLKQLCRTEEAYLAASDGLFQDTTLTFVMNNFSLDFVNLYPTDFLKEWTDRCRTANLLRSQRTSTPSTAATRTGYGSSVAEPVAGALRVFISYQRADVEYMNTLKRWLKPLESQGRIRFWTDDQLRAGEQWSQEIGVQLAASRIILVLISIDFLNSNYCWNIELKHALEKYRDERDVFVIPIVVRECNWQDMRLPIQLGQAGTFQAWEADAGLSNIQAMPKTPEGRLVPVRRWADPDEAWKAVADELKKVVAKLG
jgi:hypothetical protein